MGDLRFQLLVKNLPGLTSLIIRNYSANKALNSLSDISARSIGQLRQLVELRISTVALI